MDETHKPSKGSDCSTYDVLNEYIEIISANASGGASNKNTHRAEKTSK
ncbi:MAG: hypothetical protein RLZZ628_1017 [Bacteroidota bacterium]